MNVNFHRTSITILVGSNTKEISTLKFDPTTEPPSLTKSSSVIVGNKPSWLTRHPRNGLVVFTALKVPEAKLIVVQYDQEGNGKVVEEVSCQGDGPSSLIGGRHEVVVGNYDNGTIFTVPILDESPFIDVTSNRSQVLQLTGFGPRPTRQTSAHPHQVIFNPSEKEVFVPDLGSDKTWRIERNQEGVYRLMESVIFSQPGSGPRHAAFYGDYIYILHELSNSLASFPIRNRTDIETPSHTLPSTTLFSSALQTPDAVTAGEILIPSPNETFPIPYIYVSNRYDARPDGGDTIGIFRITDGGSTGQFEMVAEIETDFKQLRGMEFIGQDGRWLIAGGVFSGGVKVYERVDGGRGLRRIAQNEEVEVPTAFLELKV
ncbi:putative isomerase YbhE [Marasmius fiardii PR-910]|nr:putative isomerase YbhE [Marasmius fiardii PR-910]